MRGSEAAELTPMCWQMPILRWRVDYAGGTSVVGSTLKEWEVVPSTNVLVVTYWHKYPYVTHAYSEEPFVMPGSSHEKWGVTVPDDVWSLYLANLLSAPHPFKESE